MKAIVAMAPDRVIGFRGKLPWPPIKEDFRWFKRLTMGFPLLMGRSTFESIGKPLEGRYTYILTSDQYKTTKPVGKTYAYVSETQVLNLPVDVQNNLWVCGGAKVYHRFLPFCDEIYVSHIIDEYDGDTFMPQFEERFPNSEILYEYKNFWILKYWKA
jgi:dihydrofolate reductase